MTHKITLARELACPFCGSKELKQVTDDGVHFTQCKSCEATGPTGFKRGEDDAVDWNTRAALADPVPPAGYAPCSPELLESGVDCATAPRWSSPEWDGHSHWHPVPPAGPGFVENIAADSYWAISDAIGTEDGWSVLEHVQWMRELLISASDFLHDIPETSVGGNSSIVELCRRIRLCIDGKAPGYLSDMTAESGASDLAIRDITNVTRLQAEVAEEKRLRACAQGSNAAWGMTVSLAEALLDDPSYELSGLDWDYEHTIHGKIKTLQAELTKARAALAGANDMCRSINCALNEIVMQQGDVVAGYGVGRLLEALQKSLTEQHHALYPNQSAPADKGGDL